MENVDSIMAKQQNENASYLSAWNECSFSFLDMLQTSSIYDFINDESMIDDESCGKALHKKEIHLPNVRPHIAINDLNNSKDEPYANKPKQAIEIGVKIDF